MDEITGGKCQASYVTREYHVKGKIHKMIVQRAMLCGMVTAQMTSSQGKKLEVTEMKMCRWACGHTVRDHVRNDDTRDRLKVDNITERRRKARLRWFGHVKGRDHQYLRMCELNYRGNFCMQMT